MKHEYILVKETKSVKGRGTEIVLVAPKDISIPPKESIVIPLDFDFIPVTPTDSYNLMVTLDWDAAMKGLVLASWHIFKEQGVLSVMIYNLSSKPLAIPEEYDLIKVGLYSKTSFHAVKADYEAGVVNLNLTKS